MNDKEDKTGCFDDLVLSSVFNSPFAICQVGFFVVQLSTLIIAHVVYFLNYNTGILYFYAAFCFSRRFV